MSNLSRRERREARKHAQQERLAVERERYGRRRRIKSLAIWAVAVLVISLVAWLVFWQVTKDRGESFPFGSVHWHARIDITVCNETRSLRDLGSGGQHFGGLTLHTHGDNLYHLEGDPGYMERASLGAFFRAIDVPFSNQGIYEYENGGTCPDGATGLKVFVNDKPVEDPAAYVPSDKDEVRIVFG